MPKFRKKEEIGCTIKITYCIVGEKWKELWKIESKEKNIDFTCIVDGKILKFLNDGDLYALLGNILDNAVEAVDIIKDKQKRCIDFVIEERQNAIIIREDNYFIGNELKMENGKWIRSFSILNFQFGYGMFTVSSNFLHTLDMGFLYPVITAGEQQAEC